MNSRKESWFSKHNMINVQKLQHSLSKSNSMFLKINYKILHPVFVVEQQYPCIQKSFLMPEQNFDGLCFNMRQNFLIHPDILEDFYIYFIYMNLIWYKWSFCLSCWWTIVYCCLAELTRNIKGLDILWQHRTSPMKYW